MKTHSYRDLEARRNAGPSLESRSVRDRGRHAVNVRPPPAVTYRRYPSLSDDGQPYFPHLRPAHRAFVLLAILLLVVALVAIA